MNTAIENRELPGALERMGSFWGAVAAGRWTPDSLRSQQISRIRSRIFALESGSQMAGHLVGTWLMNWSLAAIDQRVSHIRNLRTGGIDRVLRACAEHVVVAMSGDPGVIRAAIGK